MPQQRVLTVFQPADKKLLRTPSAKVVEGSDIKQLCSDLHETMVASKGVGIAAPQCGVLMQVAVVAKERAPWAMGEYGVIVNPQIIKRKGGHILGLEGCLSSGPMTTPIRRDRVLVVQFFDENWNDYKLELTGDPAVTFAHEVDHLMGKCIYDSLPDWKKKKAKDYAER